MCLPEILDYHLYGTDTEQLELEMSCEGCPTCYSLDVAEIISTVPLSDGSVGGLIKCSECSGLYINPNICDCRELTSEDEGDDDDDDGELEVEIKVIDLDRVHTCRKCTRMNYIRALKKFACKGYFFKPLFIKEKYLDDPVDCDGFKHRTKDDEPI